MKPWSIQDIKRAVRATPLSALTEDIPRITSICYSLVAPDYAISISGVYAPEGGQYLESQTATSPLDAPPGLRAQEAAAANDWFATTTREIFG